MQADMTAEVTSVYAAGAVLWHREAETGKVRILVIHRTRHDDYSLPKGKVDPGETLPETAHREVLEETGFNVVLGAPLGYIEYDLPNGRHKEVHYWTAEVTGQMLQACPFAPNEEVDRVEWMSPKRARKQLSYERDRDIVDVFEERLERGIERTFALLALRHAKAVPPVSWPGSDASRPITARGQEQAELVVPILRAYAPERIITSGAVRCRATIGPLATELGLAPEVAQGISQSSFDEGLATTDEVVRDVIASRRTTVLCSHSPVMPEIVREASLATGTRPGSLSRHAMLSTAECAILHIPAEDPARGIVAAETHGPLV